ncbi:MAG: NAD(P)H-dependent oxidoreductase [Pseudomonadota bacterium]
MAHTILRIDASARHIGSMTRSLTDRLIERLDATEVITRDLADGVPLLDANWIEANFTPSGDRSPEQLDALRTSDTLVDEIRAADTLVIGTPIYNFSVPAALKAWVDLVARAGVTFRYTENGPVGLLSGKRAVVVVASGGTKAGSEIDFATGYLRHFLAFIGITDVEVAAADQLMLDHEASLNAAEARIDAIAAAA